MPVIRVEDVAFVRFQAPDLDAMAGFLEDFGLDLVERGAERLVARGAGASPVLHVTERGPAGFRSLAFRAAGEADLGTLAAAEGVEVEPLDLPGGGRRVRLRDPDGFEVEVVAGQVQRTETRAPRPWNRAGRAERLGTLKRVGPGPGEVVRLGHVVLGVSDFARSEAWYKARFGFITSDEIRPAPETAIGAFLRCDLGERPADHHTLFLLQSPREAGFNHAAFEVGDLDDLMLGHERLARAGREAAWGVGRHLLGSQIFDYWRDPFGNVLEHWTDGDLLRASDGSRVADLPALLGVQWGPPAPPALA